MGKNQDPGSGINIPDPQHWFLSTQASGLPRSGERDSGFFSPTGSLGPPPDPPTRRFRVTSPIFLPRILLFPSEINRFNAIKSYNEMVKMVKKSSFLINFSTEHGKLGEVEFMGNNPGDVFCLVRAVSVEQSKLLLNPNKNTDFVLPSPTNRR